MVVRNPGFVVVVSPECDTKIYEVVVHADVFTSTTPPARRRAVPIIGAMPGVVGKYNWFVIIVDAVKEFVVTLEVVKVFVVTLEVVKVFVVTLDADKEFVVMTDVLSEFVCTRGLSSLDVAMSVPPSTVGAVTLVVPASTDAVIVPAADNDDVIIELVSTTGVVILDLEYIVDAITSSNVSTDPRVYTGDPN